MESTTSVGTCRSSASERLSAKVSERSLLPPAVGPQTTSAVFVRFCASRGPSDHSVGIARVEHVGSRRSYRCFHVGSWRGFCIDVNRVTAPRLPDSPSILCAAMTDVNLLFASYLALVPREGVLLDLPQHLQETPLDNRIGDGPGQTRGLGAPSRGELEDVRRVECAVFDEPERLFVVLLRLARMAHYDVRAERAVRYRLPENLDLAPVPLGFVAAVHDPQHPVRSRLHGQMKPLDDGISLPDG